MEVKRRDLSDKDFIFTMKDNILYIRAEYDLFQVYYNSVLLFTLEKMENVKLFDNLIIIDNLITIDMSTLGNIFVKE